MSYLVKESVGCDVEEKHSGKRDRGMGLTVLGHQDNEENQEDGITLTVTMRPTISKGYKTSFYWWQSKEAMKLANVILH